MQNVASKFEVAAAALLTFAAFTLTLWRFGANQCFAVVALMVLFYKPWRSKLFSWRWVKQPIILLALLLIIWALISVSYSEVPKLSRALQGVTQYSKLLFLLMLPIAMQNLKYRRWVENGLIYGVLINVILSVLYYFQVPGISPLLKPHMSMLITFTVNPLQVIYVVVLALWLLMMRFAERHFRCWDVVVFVLLFTYLWLINLERSGYIVFIAVLLLFLAQQFGKKAVLLGCLAIPVFFALLYFVLPPFKDRVDVGIHNVIAYHQTENVGSIGADNSLGLRLAFTQESIAVIKVHPLLGTGIGSFKYVHTALYPEQEKSFPANDPHEAYIYVAFELGLIGLAIYIAWLVAIYKFTGTLPSTERNLLRGVWLIFVVMGFTDSGLALNAIGMSLVLWLSLYIYRDRDAHRSNSRL